MAISGVFVTVIKPKHLARDDQCHALILARDGRERDPKIPVEVSEWACGHPVSEADRIISLESGNKSYLIAIEPDLLKVIDSLAPILFY